nr:PREDICTED: uncharacterized protein KIAA0195-like [Latimeria chalumnae]|eukprot:XP_014344777.1 PREDICTED: uncharacterized protein KIAA0195-like [Latimeria chalumnae]
MSPYEHGLSTTEAMIKLHDQLTAVLSHHRKQQWERTWKEVWRDHFLHHSNRWSSLHWPGALLMLLAAVTLIGCHDSQLPESKGVEVVNGCALIVFLLLNLTMIGLQQWLKSQEMPRRVRNTIQNLDALLRNPEFEHQDMYPDLFTPPSQSISLQWTYRDGRLVNLPVSLLVEGDIIMLRPGQEAPASLRGIWEDQHVILDKGDIFCIFSSPPSPLVNSRINPDNLLQPHAFRVIKTPIIKNILECLELGHQRPATVLDNERFTAQSLLEKVVAPLVLSLLLIINYIQFIFGYPGIGPWQVTLLQLQVNGVLPVLPLTFPALWLLINAYGEARVLIQLKTSAAHCMERWLETWKICFRIFCGQCPVLCHTGSLLHSLGSITVLCCVDKQGILSWPSYKPEKVLFFSKSTDCSNEGSLVTSGSSDLENAEEQAAASLLVSEGCSFCDVSLEVLSLSQDRENLAHVQFDDPNWHRHDASLKPLGISTLLGLCDQKVVARGWQLADHLSNIALLGSRPSCLPVQVPWGMCELARAIGFTYSAKTPFQLQMYTAAYTLTTVACPQEVSPWQLKPVIKRKLPLSHMINLQVHDRNSGALELFSYGSADTILSACTDLWDGSDIKPFSLSDRKKVLDFYQRASLAGQCLALSFKPLFHPLDPEVNGKCIQLPSGMEHSHTGYQEQHDTADAEDDALRSPENEDHLQSLHNQIFLGLVSCQHQARLDMVRFISGLDHACIRFVYFSLEDELKSKVFAEKMGLETGWNCHISLQSHMFDLSSSSSISSLRDTAMVCNQSQNAEEAQLLIEGEPLERNVHNVFYSESASFIEDLNRVSMH